jgi:hypothetical protein
MGARKTLTMCRNCVIGVKNKQEYERIVNYIESNPSNWAEDEVNR